VPISLWLDLVLVGQRSNKKVGGCDLSANKMGLEPGGPGGPGGGMLILGVFSLNEVKDPNRGQLLV
jgi:hypothetical protein